jgi:hypothetical protein
MVAIWTVVSIGFHTERVVQALVERSRGGEISRWDEAPTPAANGADAQLDAVH